MFLFLKSAFIPACRRRAGAAKKFFTMNLDPSKIKKILVLMLGGIGNLILLMPTLKALREYFAQSKIILMTGEPGVEKIIEDERLIDGVRCLDRRVGAFNPMTVRFLMALRRERFDLSISSSGTNPHKAGAFTLLIKAALRVGEKSKIANCYNIAVPYIPQEHELDGSLRIIQGAGIPTPLHPQTFLTIKDSDAHFVNNYLSSPLHRLIGMHLGVGLKLREHRKWPIEKFAFVGNELIRRTKAKIVLTGGSDEIRLAEEITSLLIERPLIATGCMTIKQTAALVKRCALFISNDSGVAHIAAAVGTPLIVLFGPTNPNKTAPRGSAQVIVLKKNTGEDALHSINLITVEEVLEAVKKIIKK